MMVQTADGIDVSVGVLQALLEFTVELKDKPNLDAIGIDAGDLCATDGQSAVRFVFEAPPDAPSLARFNGRAFPASYVRERMELERSARGGRLERHVPISLLWESLGYSLQFPPLSKVEPKSGPPREAEAIAFQTHFFARLHVVARACQRARDKDEKPFDVPLPIAVLHSWTGFSLDPMRWEFGSQLWERAAHRAFVTIMPCQQETKSERKLRAMAGAQAPKRRSSRKGKPKAEPVSEGAAS